MKITPMKTNRQYEDVVELRLTGFNVSFRLAARHGIVGEDGLHASRTASLQPAKGARWSETR